MPNEEEVNPRKMDEETEDHPKTDEEGNDEICNDIPNTSEFGNIHLKQTSHNRSLTNSG